MFRNFFLCGGERGSLGAHLPRGPCGQNHGMMSLDEILLMAEILHQFIGSLSHYLQGFSTIPGGDRQISAINSRNPLKQRESTRDGRNHSRTLPGLPLGRWRGANSQIQQAFGGGFEVTHRGNQGPQISCIAMLCYVYICARV